MRRIAHVLSIAACVFASVNAFADSGDRFTTARVHLQKGRYEEALELYAELEHAKADSAQIAIGRSRAYRATGRLSESEKVLKTALDSTSKHAALWGNLAELQFSRGQYTAAEKTVQKALSIDSDQPLARMVQADLFTETGRLREAENGYRWFVRYYNRKQPRDAETLLLIARGAVQYARWNSISQIFNFAVNTLCPDALEADKNRWQSYQISGTLLLEKYNRGQALPEFRQALAINPQAAEVHVLLGRAAYQQHDLERAEKYADRALGINPRLVLALQLKADVKISAGKISQAQEVLKTALSVNPSDQRTLARLAACYVIIDGLPSDEPLNELLSNLDALEEIHIEQPDRFTRLVIELARRNPRPGYFLHILASTLEERRQFPAAERLYKHAITVMPKLSEPKTALGMLYMRVGKTKEAQRILNEAFKADPFHVRVSNMRKVLKLLDGYESITTDHFVIRVDSQADKILGRYMADYLEEIYPELVEQFGYEPPQRSQFEIYHNGKGLTAHQWFSARMIGLPWIQTIGASTGMIVALASPTASPEPFNWARVLKHEFVHVLTLQQTRFNIPHWFTEALAVTSEGYPRPPIWNQLLLKRVPENDIRNLDNLSDGFIRPKSSLDWQFAYCQSRLYAQYMIEEYGPETISKLLDAYRRNIPTDKAIRLVFGVEKKTFEKGYSEFLNKIVKGLQASANAPQKSTAELERAHLANPENSQATAEYAYRLLRLRRRQDARELAESALTKNPKEPLAAVVIAQLELLSQDVSAAVEVLKPAWDREKPNRRVLLLLAKINLTQGNNREAADLYEIGQKKFPYELEMLRGLAVAYPKLDETSKLKQVLQTLAENDYDDVDVRKKLTQLQLDDGEFEGALKAAVAALHIDVLDADVHRRVGAAYRGLKKNDHAIREFKVAIELKPHNSQLELGLAAALTQAGRKKEALKTLEAILSREPSNAKAKTLLDSLR